MSIQEQRTVVTQDPAGAPSIQSARTVTSRRVASGPGGSELVRRIVVLAFGLIQLLIALRVVLLLLDARAGNAIVSGILNLSQLFVGPFEGIFRTNALQSGGAVLDLSAIVAFVGWTIVEMIVLWVVGIARREPVGVA